MNYGIFMKRSFINYVVFMHAPYLSLSTRRRKGV